MSASATSSERESRLAERMKALGVREQDLRESFVRSGGPGGQNVNKTATCVVLVHAPTGLQVKCQRTRQQGMNRLLAREMLVAKVEKRRQEQVARGRAARAKRRYLKRRRSLAAKERMLADKAHQSRKKAMRRRVQPDS